MKPLMTALLMVNLASMGAAFSGEHNLPEVSQLKQVGRVKAFPTVKSVLWFTPMAFSSQLDCSPSGRSSYRSCTLKVLNILSDEEQKELTELQDHGQQLDSFRDLNANIVKSIDDKFEELDPGLSGGKQMLMKTLAMAPKFPYASIAFRVADQDADQILEKYRTSGLGRFQSNVTLMGERTEAYLEVRNTVLVRSIMEKALATSFSSEKLRTELKRAIESSDLLFQGMTRTEGESAAYNEIRKRYFRLGKRGRMEVRPEAMADLTESLVIMDESVSPVAFRCTASLSLKQNGEQTMNCLEDEL